MTGEENVFMNQYLKIFNQNTFHYFHLSNLITEICFLVIYPQIHEI